MLTSQGLVLATAMAVSAGTVILFDILREKYFPPTPHVSGNYQNPSLKSCLSPGSKKSGSELKKKKKKRVQFANDVKDSKGNGELYRRQHGKFQKNTCGNEMKMPANRAVLYSGILKDRVHRMEYSY